MRQETGGERTAVRLGPMTGTEQLLEQATDRILPSQYFRRRDGLWNLRELAVAVIGQALQDLRLGTVATREAERIAREAGAWFASTDDAVGSFVWWAELARVEPDALRWGLAHGAGSQRMHRTTSRGPKPTLRVVACRRGS